MIASSKLNNRQVHAIEKSFYHKIFAIHHPFETNCPQTCFFFFFFSTQNFSVSYPYLVISFATILISFPLYFISHLNKRQPENEGVNNFCFLLVVMTQKIAERNGKSYNINYGSWHHHLFFLVIIAIRYNDEVSEICEHFIFVLSGVEFVMLLSR